MNCIIIIALPMTNLEHGEKAVTWITAELRVKPRQPDLEIQFSVWQLLSVDQK